MAWLKQGRKETGDEQFVTAAINPFVSQSPPGHHCLVLWRTVNFSSGKSPSPFRKSTSGSVMGNVSSKNSA